MTTPIRRLPHRWLSYHVPMCRRFVADNGIGYINTVKVVTLFMEVTDRANDHSTPSESNKIL